MTGALSGRLPGATVASVRLGPVHDGTNARARAYLSYSSGLGPPAVFVKRAGRVVPRVALVALRALGTEARLAASGVALPLEHPRPFGGGVRPGTLDTVVVMDDVAVLGGVPASGASPLPVDAVADGLEGLARLHGRFTVTAIPASLGFLRPWCLGRGWARVSVASLRRGMRRASLCRSEAAGAETAFTGGAGAAVTGGAGAAGAEAAVTGGTLPRGLDARRLGSQFAASARLAARGPQCFLHGDPHPGNTYALAGGGIGFLDWQLARIGHWSHDVGYFLVGSLSVEDRRTHERSLLADYLQALERAGGSPPPWAVAWARYCATPAFGLATWLHTLSFGSFQPVPVCLATIARFAAAYDDLDTARSAVAEG